VGFGPGTFPAEFVRHRLDAEIAAKRRLTTPLTTSSYGEAHNDYLQPFAEEGVPAALALLGAAALVVAATARRAARSAGAERTEAALLLGLLTAGATAALTWFPFQRPITALPLLFALGRAWRLGAGDDDGGGGGGEEASAPASALPVVLALAVALGLLYRPEIARYGAERRLRSATDGLRFLLTHPAEVPDPPRALESIALLAGDAVPALPGDPRPLLVQGSARLVRGEAARAIEAYRSALALGERAELDLNLGRAYERLGREEDARAAYLRAAWVSPALIPAMMPDVQGSVATEVARREAALAKGELKEPPPLPAISGPPGP
jgi:tetratricopeptide (TPR) repeat protein